MFLLLLAALLTSQAQARPDAAKNELSLREVLDRWEAGADLIESYDVTTVLREKTLLVVEKGVARLLPEPDAPSLASPPSHIWRKGAKRRGEFAEDGDGGAQVNALTTMVWDGTTGHVFQGNETVVIHPFLVCFGRGEYADYEASYRMVWGTTDRIAMSRKRKSKLLPREGRLYVVDVPSTTPGDYWNLKWRVWLDPDRNFMPVKQTLWFVNKGHEQHSSDSEYLLREVRPGVWAPVKATIRVYSKNEESFPGKLMYVGELRVIEEKSRFNIDLPDDLFAVKIPDGVNVIDKARNASYVAGSENAEKYLPLLARNEAAKLKQLTPADRMPPAMVFIPDDDRPWYANPIGIGVLAAAVVLTIFVLVRLRARKAA